MCGTLKNGSPLQAWRALLGSLSPLLKVMGLCSGLTPLMWYAMIFVPLKSFDHKWCHYLTLSNPRVYFSGLFISGRSTQTPVRALWWLTWPPLRPFQVTEFNLRFKYYKVNSEWKHGVNMQIQFLMYHNEQQTYLMNYFQKNKFKYHLQ